MPNLYTRDGDDGTTGLLGEGRVPKYHPRTEANGDVDEAAAALGLARALTRRPSTRTVLETLQRDLYHLMAEVAATPEEAGRFRSIDPSRVAWLEMEIDRITGTADLKGFILAGDTPAAGALDLARTVLRRAERRVARLTHDGDLSNPDLLRYLNRASSLCFALELAEVQAAGLEGPTLARPEAT